MSTVLVVGSGGREHALAWKLSQSPQVSRVIAAPGNSGMSSSWERWPVSLAQGRPEFEALAARAKQEGVSLVVVGPDQPLADGIVDVFEAHGMLCFGPNAKAAQIEASKAFAKEVMISADIPTAQYRWVKSEEEARKLLKSLPWQGQAGWVLKADGLALGKGVRVCSTLEEALEAVPPLFQLSSTLVIEKRLLGEEVSWMAFCDGTRCSLMEPARDYKRLLDRNEGPNTGGMGAFSPVPEVPDTWYERVQQTVFLPLLTELKRRGAEFRGLLYAGLMVDWKSDQFWVLEFNARFGDPETQVLMPRMADDLFSWCAASARGDLNQFPSRVPFKDEAAVYVVAASSGYPGTPKTGVPIRMEELGKSTCFFSGVELTPEGFVTSGGRVLGTLGQGKDLEKARKNAYSHLSQIYFEGMQFRSDIGKF